MVKSLLYAMKKDFAGRKHSIFKIYTALVGYLFKNGLNL
ncbi:hypothetical protein CU016_1607 [Enterococcus lactis]|nr:hypothetical protein EfmE1071_1857 [Enterococcus faecium E1071]MBL5008280.1 hypothetical protein [Enterococcus lactis]MBL5014842.1 hypothetical protein [Enterococcus lactis]